MPVHPQPNGTSKCLPEKYHQSKLLTLLAIAFSIGLHVCLIFPTSSYASADDADVGQSDYLVYRLCSEILDELSAPISYPTAWLAVPQGEIPAGSAVELRYLPDIDIDPHRKGKPIPNMTRGLLELESSETSGGNAVIAHEGQLIEVDPNILLVNLPDIMPNAEYDIVYSYASTSRCNGYDIPGVTNRQLPGYAEGKQESAYWGDLRYAVPCAYQTALKALLVENDLEEMGYRLLVYDAYRPMTAQYYLSDAFAEAYYSDQAIQDSVGEWSLSWYVAPGASGHNYGADLDVGLCDISGAVLEMPSAFDAFDEAGHLTDAPMDKDSITPEAYRDSVRENGPCLALHDVFTKHGFSELASEWWHFGDDETMGLMQSLISDEGLDFVAQV